MKKASAVALLLLVLSNAPAFAQQVAPKADANQTPQQQPASQPQTPPASPQAQAPVASPGKPILEDGTPVKLRLTRNVSSADARVGDTVDFEVLEEVRVGDLLVCS